MTALSDVACDVAAADLVAAVEAGVVEESAARALVDFVATRAAAPSPTVDEEDVRFVTSFNDLFVTIGIALLVGAVISVAVRFAEPLAGPLVAVLAWGLAEIFTRRRRMAFPSIVLVALFVIACGWTAVRAVGPIAHDAEPVAAGIAALAAGFAHWKRFGVPISVAAMSAGAALTALGMIGVAFPVFVERWLSVFVFVLGLAVFAHAMRWDASDRQRRSRRTDTAFWLHILAAPMIVHPLAWGLGGAPFGATPGSSAVTLLALVAVLAVVAVVVDRRALLVSALIYLGGSLIALVRVVGVSGSMQTSLGVGLVGVLVLLLSIGWTPLRRSLLRFVPAAVRAHVPAAHPAEATSS